MNIANTINAANATPLVGSSLFEAACSLESPAFRLGCLLRALSYMINEDTMPDGRSSDAALELILYAQAELDEIKEAHEILYDGLRRSQGAIPAKAVAVHA